MIVAFDLETTGLDEESKIIEIALLKFDKKTFQIIDSLSTLVNPDMPLPLECMHVTGITDTDVLSAPFWDDAMRQKVTDFIGDAPVLAHNAEFDVGMLARHWIDLSENIILDTFELSRMLYFDVVSLNLWVLCDIFGILIGQAHRAYDDTLVTIQIFQKCCETIHAFSEAQKKSIEFLFSYVSTPQSDWYREYFGWKTLFSPEDFQSHLLDSLDFLSLANTISHHSPPAPKNIPDFSTAYERIFGRSVAPQQKECIDQCVEKKDQKHFFTYSYVGNFPEILSTHLALDFLIHKEPILLVASNMDRYHKALQQIAWHFPISFQIRFESLLSISLDHYFSYLFSKNRFSFSQLIFLAKITLWLLRTKTGNLNELSWYPQEHQYRVFLESLSGESAAYIGPEKADILLVTPAYFLQEYSGQKRHIYVTDVHLLEEQIYEIFQYAFDVEAIERIATELIESGQYASIGTHMLEKTKQFSFFLSHYIQTTQDDTENVQICISSLWEHIQEYCSDCRQSLSSVSVWVCQFSLRVQIGKILSVLNSFYEHDMDNWDIILRKYESKMTLCFTPISAQKLLCPLFEHVSTFHVFSPISSFILQDFIKKRLGMSHFVSTDASLSIQQAVIVPTDVKKNDFQKKIVFLSQLLAVYPGKICVITASKMESQSIFLALLEEVPQRNRKMYAQGVSWGQQKIFYEFAASTDPAVLIGTPDFLKKYHHSEEQIGIIWFRFRFFHPFDPFFLSHSQMYENNFLEYSLPKTIIQWQALLHTLLDIHKKALIIVLDSRIDSSVYGEQLQNIFAKTVIVKHTTTADFLAVLRQKLNSN